MTFSEAEEKALAMVPKFSATLSLFGSGWIVTELIMMPEKQTIVYHRLLGMFALLDILESIWNFASSWPIPQGTEDVFGAKGTTATCTAQGFFLQLGSALPLYNASISLYYMYTIRYNYSEQKLQQRVEKWMQGVPLAFGLITSVIGLGLELYNASGLWCWIAELPDGCTQDGNCTRGEHAEAFRWAFFYAPLWAVFLVVVWALAVVHRGIYKCEKRTARYRHFSTASDLQSQENGYWENWAALYPRSYAVASQSLCYIAAFYVTHTFGTVNRLVEFFGDARPFWLAVLHAFTDPLQGFLNWLVYRRPKYLQIRKRHPEISSLRAAWWTMQWTVIEKKLHPSITAPHGLQHSHRSARVSELIRMEIIQDVEEEDDEIINDSETPEETNHDDTER